MKGKYLVESSIIMSSHGKHYKFDDPREQCLVMHKRIPMDIQFPDDIEVPGKAQVNIMAPMSGCGTLEEMASSLAELMSMRDELRDKGYGPGEKVGWYDEGPELIYEVPTTRVEDIARILKDFSFE